MYNWSKTNSQQLPSEEQRRIWQLEQTINFGLNNTKISASQLKKYWDTLRIDPTKQQLLALLLRDETITTKKT
jgi:hypothetical protein